MRRLNLPVLLATAWISVLGASPAHAETLYDALGGQPGLVRIVDSLMRRNLVDDRLRETLEETNTDRLKRLLVTQFCELSGGPCVYRGRDMRRSHSHLNITTADFNALVENLQAAMDESGVPFRTQNRLLALLAPMYSDMVKR